MPKGSSSKLARKGEPTKSSDVQEDSAKKVTRRKRSGPAFARAKRQIKLMQKESNPSKFISAARHSNITRQRFLKIAQEEHDDDTKFMFSDKFFKYFHALSVCEISDHADMMRLFSRHAKRPTMMPKDFSAARVAIGAH